MTEPSAGPGGGAWTIGVISDTHGLLRPEAVRALTGVSRILHAGDIGRPQVVEALRRIAPVDAIRGNVDTGPWAAGLPESITLTLGGRRIHMLHDLMDLRIDPAAAGIDAVIYGHSHKPAIRRVVGVLHFNPGSAGPRRFRLPVTLGFLRFGDGRIDAAIHDLAIA